MKKLLLIILGSCLSFSSKAQSEFLPNLFEDSSWQLSIGESNGAQRAAIGYVTPKIWQFKFKDQSIIRMNLETEFAY